MVLAYNKFYIIVLNMLFNIMMYAVRKKQEKGKYSNNLYIFNKFSVPYIIQNDLNPDIAILYFSLLGSIKCGGKCLFSFISLDYWEVQEAKSIQICENEYQLSVFSTSYCQEHLSFDFPNDSSLRIIIMLIMFHRLSINPLIP